MSYLIVARGIMEQKHRTSISNETNIYWKVYILQVNYVYSNLLSIKYALKNLIQLHSV